VQGGAEAVILVSVDLESFAQSVKAALGAGVAMACVMCVPNVEYIDLGMHYAAVDFRHQGEVMGWYAINQSNGVGKIVNALDPGVKATVLRAEGVSEIVSDNCDTCVVLDQLVVPAASLSKPGPPEWTAYLSGNPEGTVTTAVSFGDVLGTLMAKSQKDAGRSDVSIMGYDATDEGVAFIKSGDMAYAGTVALPYMYAAYAAADLVARDLAGTETWDASSLPVRLITPENVADFTEFAPVGDWQAELASLWGVS
jgi:ABC-type sugar transport system substrate-binding protein